MKTAKFVLITLVICLFTSSLFSQNDDNSKRTVGLSATIQSEQFGINIPIWIYKNVTIGPAIQLLYSENVGTDLGLGLVSKFYINNGKVSPYVGIKLGFISNIPNETTIVQQMATTDIIGGFAFGGEYFFDKQFSISIEIQGNFTKSDPESQRFGNPDGLNFNTASMISANIYF
ncbi:MAG: hypothetical protein HGB12_13585 [Bacteroidetes bacterium]|nr:hypothetical protein [Bacteroidota bacterium]